ncbi:carotenoid biosynthesis protein [Bradyrhizobium elkanii]|uniref:Carotenoid biosynthesis protein n=1 Tax=Bradyrhizobium elkanii TaxID=29448 RepID=A0A4U6RY83_BRAEL|nr:carotenoid biosynthesis protein [Bradyrhizobium elkanii]TKV80174.1 carotenoid biosynthesis protein [Bradyrhizobium elkanii]
MRRDDVSGNGLWTWQKITLWASIASIVAAAIGFSWNPSPLAQALAAVFIACALIHAALNYGLRQASMLFVLCSAIAFTMESLGTATGFPFGSYQFELADLPNIGLVPLIIGPFWFGAGYFSWTVASILLDGADRQLDRTFNLIALPVVAAFVVTQLDLVMDAPNATIAKAWIWHDGGGVFGVPLSNYLGWLLTSWFIFQSFALCLRRSWILTLPRMNFKLSLTSILFYLGAGLTHIVPWIMGQTGEAVDARGYGWQVHDIREATVAILLLTMVFTALLAALHVLRLTSSNSSPVAFGAERR